MPPVPLETLRFPFHQGLLESQEDSKVPVGYLTELINWVPEPTGALRVRGAWQRGSLSGAPTTRQNRGIGTFNRFTDPVVVQASSVFHNTTNTGSITPSLSWAVPTRSGNTLVAFVSFCGASTGPGTLTSFTATGWTARNAMPTGSYTINQTFTGVYELTTTQAYSGSISPFSYVLSFVGPVSITIVILELGGVGAFDKFVTGTLTNQGPGTSTQTLTTAATTQASEMVLAFGTGFVHNAIPSTITLSTASTGWTEYLEDDHSGQSNFSGHAAAVYQKVVRATGTQSIAIAAVHPGGTGEQSGAIITYKGWNPTDPPPAFGTRLLAANYNGTTSDVYIVDRDALSTAPFSVVDAALPSSGEPIAFVMGMGAAFYTAASFIGIRTYDGTSASTVATSPVGAKAIAISHDRMWVSGTPAYPSRLFFTQLLLPAAWTGTGSGYFDVGNDDGEFIEDITPFNDGLLIGKSNSLWFLAGTDTGDFALSQLPAGGAAPGRSLLTTPFGAVVAGRDQVWLYDGSTVTRLGNAIERSYGVTGPFVSCSYQDGSIYIADAVAGKVFSFDLGGTVGTWRIETCEDTIGILYNVGGRQFMGPYSSTVGSLINYRDFPDPIRGKDYDPLSEDFSMRTGDQWIQGALNNITPRQLYLQLRQRADGFKGLTVTPRYNGVDLSSTDIDPPGAGTSRVTVEGFGRQGRTSSIGFSIMQTLTDGEASCFDIEDAWVEYIREGRG